MLINNPDLNNACAIKWKKQKFLNPKPNKIIIMPNCLRVERAITFLRSDSKMAQILEISIVRIPVMKIKYRELSFIKSNKRNIKNTPAVTRVEEWTSEETGVGAAIANGSHLEKGSCALLVNLANTKIKGVVSSSQKINFHPPILKLKNTPTNKKTSPSRFVRTVSMAELVLLLLP